MESTVKELVMTLPADTPEYMYPAWAGALHWAIGNHDIMAEFRRDTGMTFTPGASPLERMIDKATGVEYDFAKTFVDWFNAKVWGPINGPEKIQG